MAVSRGLCSLCILSLLVLCSVSYHPFSTSLAVRGHATQLTVTGVSDSIDYPIFASISGGTADTRVITVTNPVGNLGIESITISIPSLAVSSTPSGTIPAFGGVADCSLTACSATLFGTGPYALVYSDTSSGGSGKVILPSGSTIQLTITMVPETSTTSTSAADTFSLALSSTDTNSGATTLGSIVIYETTNSSIFVTNPSSLTQTAGVPFTIGVQASQTGIPLDLSVSTGTSSAVTINPSVFTTSSSTASISVVDSSSENLVVTASGSGVESANDVGGLLPAASTSEISIGAYSSPLNTLTLVSPIALFQFPNGGPLALNATFRSSDGSPLNVVVIAVFYNSIGQAVSPFPTATATVNGGATVSTYELLNGLPPGTYSASVFAITDWNSDFTTAIPVSLTATISFTIN